MCMVCSHRQVRRRFRAKCDCCIGTIAYGFGAKNDKGKNILWAMERYFVVNAANYVIVQPKVMYVSNEFQNFR